MPRRAAYHVHVLKLQENLKPKPKGICTRSWVSRQGGNIQGGSRALKTKTGIMKTRTMNIRMTKMGMPNMRTNDENSTMGVNKNGG